MTPGGRRATIAAGLALVVVVAGARVAATWTVFSATADETQHIAGGIQWLEGRSDLWRTQQLPHVMGNPPLARIFVGLGPYLNGVRDTALRDLLYAGPGAEVNLVAARRGTLPFLVLLVVLVWATTRRLFGDAAALAAAAAVSTVPAVLGHAGLATTDVAAAAMFMLAFLAFARWLERPTPGRAAALGLAFGLAFVTKMSAMTLLPAALVVVVFRARARDARVSERPRVAATRVAAEVALAAGVAAVVAWAVYRFSFGRPDALADPAVLRSLIDGCAAGDGARRALGAALHVPLPAPEIADGLLVLCAYDGPGRATSYLLGQISQDGFRAFFPVALAVKSPLPFLALAAFGLARAARETPQGGSAGSGGAQAPAERWRRLAPALVALTILVSVIPSRINIGVRHVLVLYPLLAVYAGHGLVSLWHAARRGPGRAVAVGLAAWQLAIPTAAGPDDLAWFNALAGRHPENVLLDSDLDWGQDLRRLEATLADRHVARFSVAYFGPSDLCREPLPAGRWLRPYERTTGVIAISQMYRKGVVGFYYRDGNYCDRTQLVRFARPDPAQFAWLDAYAPIARVGQSILLYDIPAGGASQ